MDMADFLSVIAVPLVFCGWIAGELFIGLLIHEGIEGAEYRIREWRDGRKHRRLEEEALLANPRNTLLRAGHEAVEESAVLLRSAVVNSPESGSSLLRSAAPECEDKRFREGMAELRQLRVNPRARFE